MTSLYEKGILLFEEGTLIVPEKNPGATFIRMLREPVELFCKEGVFFKAFKWPKV